MLLRRPVARATALSLLASAAISCGGDSSGPSYGPPFRVTIVTGNAQSGTVGTPLATELTVKVTDVEGRAVPNAIVSWLVTGGGGSVAFDGATSKTNREGRSTARWTLGPSAGTQAVNAMVPTLPTAVFNATALAGPAQVITVTPQTATVVRGASQQYTATARDAHNNLISNPQVAWSTSNTDVANVQPTGLVTGGVAGEAITITASIAGKTGTASLTVVEPLPLVVSTDELEEARLTVPFTPALTATGGSVGHQWRVSGGQLPPGVSLTGIGRFTGTPMQLGVFAFDVTVRDAIGTEASRSVSVQVCEAPVNLAVGESFIWHFPHTCGVALPSLAGAAFRVGAVARSYQTSGSTASAVPGGLRLRASPRSVQAGAVVVSAVQSRFAGEDDAFDSETRRLMRTTEAVHLRLRDEEMRQSFGPRLPLGPHDQMLAIRASQSVPPEQRTFFINNPAGGQRLQINATLRGSSASILYYQDDAAIGTNDDATAAEVQAVLEYYELFGKSVIENVFGGLGPLGTTNSFAGGARLAGDIDGNGRFIVVGLTDGHMLSGAAGYVTSCDRSPAPGNANGTPTCTGSNEAEITYILRPVNGFYLGTVVHEAKHIASHGYARFGGRGFNPSWIEEGTADIAKELSSRNAMGANEGLMLRYADIYPGGAVTNASYGVSTVQSRARSFLRAAPLHAIIGDPNPNPNGSTYYGSSWLFHRYLADRYANGTQAAFFRQMNTTGTGPQAIEQATGRPFADLLAEFAIAVGVEGSQAAKQASQYRFVSYDFADVASRFAGGPWPYFRATGAYQALTLDLPTYFSAPNFFEFVSVGAPVLRIDLERLDGQPVFASHDVALSIVRVR